MITIVGEAAVSCYADAVSFLVMILLLFSEHLRERKNASFRILYILNLCVASVCAFSFIYHAMYMQTAPWCHTAALAAKTLRECFVLAIITLWLIYISQKLYGEKKQRSFMQTPMFRLAFLPFTVFLLLLIANLFTGIVFTYSAENRIEPRPLLYIIILVEFIYFCSSAAIVHFYDRKTMKIRFLHVSPMIVSVALASSAQFYTPFDIGSLGYVIGFTLLYFSMISELRFVDQESGLFNRGYLNYLFDLALSGKNDTNSALILEVAGNLQASFDILRNTLHQSGDVIRLDNNLFVMFSRTDSRSTMQYLSSLAEEALEKYNEENPDQKAQITVRCRMREQDEDVFTYLRTVLDEKESGDSMQGIVSMMSDLERLDKELKLAADIQSSILPMKFPPFPDRTEFDIYASMTPAKKVGGDFYDFFLIDSDHLALVIADVSDKGIPAALFMMISKTLIKNQLMSGCSPAEALERVNLQLCEHNSSMMFVTVWLAVLEISTGKGLACNAGHEKPAVMHAGGDYQLLEYKHDMFIGAWKKAKYHEHEFELHPGDCVLVYTDGVTEAADHDKKMFGEARLVETLNQHSHADPKEQVCCLRDALDRFADGAPQFDDITILSMKYYGMQMN